MIERQKISSEQQWKSLVYDYISSGKRGKSNFYEHIRTQYKCEKSNSLKKYDIYEIEYDLNLNKGKDDAIQEMQKEAIKMGIKSKNERILNLQTQISDIQNDIDSDYYDEIQGNGSKVTKKLTPTDKAFLRKTIKDIQSDISKIEGDFAPVTTVNEIKGISTITIE